MPYKKTLKRRILALIVSVLLMLAMLPVPASANEPHIAYIGITSDVHGAYNNVVNWITNNGSSLEYMVFGGDTDNTWNPDTIYNIKTYAVSNSITPIFTMGNHDWWGGGESAFKEATGYSRTGIQNNPAADGYTIYTLGASSDSTNSNFKEEDILELGNALANSDLASPFFIISHYPLHSGEGRSGRNVTALIELLNQYPNVFFFWGHNHHQEKNMSTIKAAGDTITAADSGKSTPINFTYCNSGHMGNEHGLGSGKDGTGVKVEICIYDSEASVNLSILDIQGNILAFKHVSLGQVISVTDIAVPVAGAIPDTTATVSGGAVIENLTWSPAVNDYFKYDTVYTVSFILYTDFNNPSVTVNGMPAQCVVKGNGALSVSYTFPKTMPDPQNSVTYVKTSTICDGKEYAIVLNGVAMSNVAATGSTSYYNYIGLSYTQPSIEGDYLTIRSLEEAQKVTWTFISAGEENKWFLKNGDLYLYATAPRTMTLSEFPQAWTYGEMGDKGIQLHIVLNGEACNLNYGGETVVDMIYPSVNNKSTLAIYEKVVSAETNISHVNLEIAAPSAGSRPDRTARVTSGEAAAEAVTWSPEVTETFGYKTVYRVSVKLVPYEGYVFTGATSVKFNGSDATGKQLNSDGTLTATFEFPETAPDPAQIVTFVRTDTIIDGHEYAIVLDNLAMNNMAASDSRYTGLFYTIPMTIDDDYLTIYSLEQADKATWMFLNAGKENMWHIKNGDKYLYAPESGKLTLSVTEQTWTYGPIDKKGIQLYTDLDKRYNLCYGSTRADLIYPSSNNYNELRIYEKVAITDDIIGNLALEVEEPSAGRIPAGTAAVINGEATVTGILWSPPVGDTFDYDTAYTVNILLAANNGYRFSAATVVTINGNIAKKTLNSDGTLTAEIEFPPTASDPTITIKYIRTDEIVSGHEYAIVFDGYAMNTTQVSETRSGNQYLGLSFYSPVIDGEYLIFKSAAEARAATWTFTDAAEEGKWYISNGGKYLYASDSRKMELGDEPQAWACGKSDDGRQLSVDLKGKEYVLFNGQGITANMIYPSSSNRSSVSLYEKIVIRNEGILEVSVSGITAPSAGSVPDMDAVVSPDTVTAGPISWTPEVKGRFEHNTIYTASITLSARIGYYFTDQTTVRVNNEPASNIVFNGDGSLTVELVFPPTAPDTSQTFIGSADILITAPVAGSIPDENSIVSHGEATAGKVSWSPNVAEAFAYDTVYTATVTLSAKPGYYLTNETNVTVNGKPASKATFGSDGSLTVEYVFPKTEPNPSLPSIDAVALTLTAPAAGSAPDTKAVVSQGEATAGKVSWSPSVDEAFAYDKVYTVTVILSAKTGYRFTAETTATVNGKSASKVTFGSDGSLTVEYVFPKTEPNPSLPSIDAVALTLTAPAAGSAPDTKAVVSQGEATAGKVSWSPSVDEAFSYDTVYTAAVTLTAKTGYRFTSKTTVTVNGYNAETTLNSDGSLTVEYVFPKTEPEPSLQSINTVALAITAPAAGSAPDTSAVVSHGEATAGKVSWSPSVNEAFSYDTVYTAAVTLTAKTGYRFTSKTTVTVNGYNAETTLNSDGTLSVRHTFPQTGSDRLYTSVFTAPSNRYFWDVSKDAWYYKAVQYVIRKGIIDSITQTSFEPHSPMIRAMFIQITYRLESSYGNFEKPGFDDVNPDMWYYDAVAWAAANGIIKGYSDKLFGPEDNVTREQFITILYRYARYKGYSDNNYTQVVLPFTDALEISDYAVSAIKWAYYEQLIVNENQFRPKAVATRAEIADTLMRYHMAFIDN